MKKQNSFFQKHLSVTVFIFIYLIMVGMHIFLDSFIWSIQIDLLTTMLPFIVLGFIIDFILSRRTDLKKSYRITAQILPVFVVLLIIYALLLEVIEREPGETITYLIWPLISIPFFIASYEKHYHKKRLICTLIGVAAILFTYLFLTTQTDELTQDTGAVVYFVSYFMMFYAASYIRKIPYISIIIGVLNSIFLLWIRFTPNNDIIRWDYDLFYRFELIMLTAFILCIIIRLVGAFQKKDSIE